jgi:hypothetical protein
MRTGPRRKTSMTSPPTAAGRVSSLHRKEPLAFALPAAAPAAAPAAFAAAGPCSTIALPAVTAAAVPTAAISVWVGSSPSAGLSGTSAGCGCSSGTGAAAPPAPVAPAGGGWPSSGPSGLGGSRLSAPCAFLLSRLLNSSIRLLNALRSAPGFMFLKSWRSFSSLARSPAKGSVVVLGA